MTNKAMFLALMTSSASALAAAPAFAQTATPDTAEAVRSLEAQVKSLQAQIDALKAQIAATPPPAAVAASEPAPVAKEAPQVAEKSAGAKKNGGDKQSGFTFKPKGFLQFDAGYVSTPGPERAGTVGGLNYNNLGWNARARRLVLGGEGSLPGGFGYKAEFNFAQGSLDYEDIVLTYQPSKSPLQVTIGNFYPLSSLETMTSSRLTSFLERVSFTDAFVYNRRLGMAVGLVDPDNEYTLTAGLFGQEINNSSFNRTGWQASARGTYSPELGSTRLHLGANFQHRVAQRDAQNIQYRSRPFTQITDQRFVDTGAVAADGDDILGLEFGAIAKSVHVAAEAQNVWVRGLQPGHMFGVNNGAGGGVFYAGDPSFFAGYAEIGYYLTGETRGYKAGKWDRTKVLKGFDKGGWGALQANLRFDYLDLRDRVGSGATLAAPDYINGGRQLGYELSLIWNPIDYVRFMAQYAHGAYSGGPRATTVAPGSSEPANERDFGVDTFAVRAQVEF